MAGDEQVEEADVISQVARVDDVECDVSRQTKLAEMKGVTRPQRHRYLPCAGRVTTLTHAVCDDAIRGAILTCARKPTSVSLIYRTEPTTKKCKTEKLICSEVGLTVKVWGIHVVSPEDDKKLSYRRGTARCAVSVEILPIATQQCRNYLYDKS